MELKDLGEFGLIRRLLAGQTRAAGVIVPPGDDAAVLEVTAGQRLVLTCDCMVEDVHFLAKAQGYDAGYKMEGFVLHSQSYRHSSASCANDARCGHLPCQTRRIPRPQRRWRAWREVVWRGLNELNTV